MPGKERVKNAHVVGNHKISENENTNVESQKVFSSITDMHSILFYPLYSHVQNAGIDHPRTLFAWN